jgi:hypothetical protein
VDYALRKYFFMTRNGKIARLPQPIREQINRRLQNGEEGKQIAEWLNTLPEVTALMTAEFDGQPINEPNLSRWKLGGYRDWEEQQEALEAVRRFNADAAELSQEAGGRLGDRLALCLTARIAIALRQTPSAGDDPAGQLDRLRRLCADLAKMRKGDHNAEWLRIERGKLDLDLKKHKEAVAARKRELEDLKNPHGKAVTKEAWEELERELKLA